MWYNTGVVNLINSRGDALTSRGLGNCVGGAATMLHHNLDASSVKTCSKCGESRPINQFAKDRTRKDGLQCCCRSCQSAFRRERYWNDEAYREKQRAQWREYRQRPGVRQRKQEWDKTRGYQVDPVRARVAVGTAVTRGHLPPAWTMVCSVCQEAQAAHWHHHNGYGKDHWLDVVPVCRDCHGKEHWGGEHD